MPAECFDFNVYKQTNVNMVIRSRQHYSNDIPRAHEAFHQNYTTISALLNNIDMPCVLDLCEYVMHTHNVHHSCLSKLTRDI